MTIQMCNQPENRCFGCISVLSPFLPPLPSVDELCLQAQACSGSSANLNTGQGLHLSVQQGDVGSFTGELVSDTKIWFVFYWCMRNWLLEAFWYQM